MSNEDQIRAQLWPIEREVKSQAGEYVDDMAMARERVSRENGDRDRGEGPFCNPCYYNHPLECDRDPPCKKKQS